MLELLWFDIEKMKYITACHWLSCKSGMHHQADKERYCLLFRQIKIQKLDVVYEIFCKWEPISQSGTSL